MRRTGPSECLAHLRDRKHLIATALEAGVERRGGKSPAERRDTLPNGDEGRWIGDFNTMAVAGWKAGRDLH